MGDLKRNLADLRSWVDRGDDLELDDAKRRKINSVKTQLATLKDNSSPASSLTWSYGVVLVGEIEKRKISSATCQSILSTFVNSLSSSNIQQIIVHQENLWQMLLISNNVNGLIEATSGSQTSLYYKFLSNCFQNMRKPDICDVMIEFVTTSQVSCLHELVNEQQHHKILLQILDLLMVQLVHPFSDKAQETAKSMLKSCGWKIADPIREVLNEALIYEDDTVGHFASQQDVYQTIFELILINKDLVVGLVNNTELCLTYHRQDRLVGVEFFCKLFGAKVIPGVPRPSELYSHLWETFLLHCRNNSLLEPSELLILAKYTSDILNRSDTHDAWCSLLFFIFQYRLPKDCELALLTGITTAIRSNPSLVLQSGPMSLGQLISNFLSPFSEYRRGDKGWKLLMEDLSNIYYDVATAGIMNMNLLTFHEICSWILTCLLSPCRWLSPRNEKWCMLRKLFVKKLVPFDIAEEDRMKMYLFLWINTNLEDWSILHELFQKTRTARQLTISILHMMKDNTTFMSSKNHLVSTLSCLSRLIISPEGPFQAFEFLAKKFVAVLVNTPEVRRLMGKLLCSKSSCDENFQNTARIKQLLLIGAKNDSKVIDGLLYYLSEITFDTSSMKHLCELVDTCVSTQEISSSIGENRLHVARTSLRLFNEALFMEPRLGIEANVLNSVFKWTKLPNGSLSMLALRCLTPLSPHCIGTEFVEKMLPVWFQVIGCGSSGQVKMAIRCVALHSSSPRDENLSQVFKIITNSLKNPNDEAFARGVSALGHFAAVTPLALKTHVEEFCVSVLLQGVIKQFFTQHTSSADSVKSDSSNNTWVPWEELPLTISTMVRALRSVGRCMRYCGTGRSVAMALLAFKAILTNSGDAISQLRELDKDQLWCEAASAMLHIFETAQFRSMVSKELLFLLSHVITHPRLEVRSKFAEKLVQGLCIYKPKSCKVGRSRGNLPPCMLGLLALLGSDVWMETPELKAKAEALVKEVCVSRHIAVTAAFPFQLDQFFEKNPHLVMEIIFVAAVPIIAEHSLFQSWSFPDENFLKGNVDMAVKVSECFQFIITMVCHPETYGGQVSKDYIQKMFDKAKLNVFFTNNPAMAKTYAVVFELLEIFLKMYVPKANEPVTPPVQLPLPFYTEKPHEPIDKVPYFTEANVIEIRRYLSSASRKRKFVFESAAADEEPSLNESESCVQDDSPSSSLSSREHSLNNESSMNSPTASLSPTASISPEIFPRNQTYSFGEPLIHSTPTGDQPMRRRYQPSSVAPMTK